MFQFDEEREEYVAEFGGVEFICEELEDGMEEEAQRLSELYWEKLPEMLEFMLPELRQIYGALDPASLPEMLGKPTVDLLTCQVMYLQHTLDDTHIIELEYGGDFEELYNFAIDG